MPKLIRNNRVYGLGSGSVTKANCYRSVKDYGAIGNGVADDTAAIQSAITAEDSIYFPPGAYIISNPITLKKGTKIFADEGKAVIKASQPKDSNDKWLYMLKVGSYGVQSGDMDIVIDGLTVSGNSGIANWRSTRSQVYDRGESWGTAQAGIVPILIANCSGVQLRNVRVIDNNYVGINVVQADRVSIENCRTYNTDVGVLFLQDSTVDMSPGYVIIDNCRIEGHSWSEGIGLWGRNTHQAVMITNTMIMDKFAGNGILIGDSEGTVEDDRILQDVHISDCYVSDCATGIVTKDKTYRANVSNCSITGCRKGLLVGGNTKHSVFGNITINGSDNVGLNVGSGTMDNDLKNIVVTECGSGDVYAANIEGDGNAVSVRVRNSGGTKDISVDATNVAIDYMSDNNPAVSATTTGRVTKMTSQQATSSGNTTDLSAYRLKSDSYSKTEVDNKISSATGVSMATTFPNTISSIAANIRDAKATGSALTFVLLSDLHLWAEYTRSQDETNRQNSESQYKSMLENLKLINDRIHPDAMICIGDLLNTQMWWAKPNMDDYEDQVFRVANDLKSCGMRFIPAAGNHDGKFISAETQAAASEASNYKDIVSNLISIADADTGADPYYYVDYSAKKIRVVVLCSNRDSSAAEIKGYDTSQMAWFAGVLQSTPDGYSVVIVQHISPARFSGNTNVSMYSSIVQAMNNNSSITVSGVSYSFSTTAKVILELCGHYHGDHITKPTDQRAVVPCISKEIAAAGYLSSEVITTGDTYDTSEAPSRSMSDATQHLLDVCVLVPDQHKLYCFRFGAGRSSMIDLQDYTVTYSDESTDEGGDSGGDSGGSGTVTPAEKTWQDDALHVTAFDATKNGVTMVYDSSTGIYTVNGTATANAECGNNTGQYAVLEAGNYKMHYEYISGSTTRTTPFKWYYGSSATVDLPTAPTVSGEKTFTVAASQGSSARNKFLLGTSGNTFTDLKFRFWIEAL